LKFTSYLLVPQHTYQRITEVILFAKSFAHVDVDEPPTRNASLCTGTQCQRLTTETCPELL